jgi:hypothetical protein
MAAGMSFFADGDDLPLLLARLNDDADIAFIVEKDSGVVAGSGARWVRYQLQSRVDALPDGNHRLWHAAGHPLSAHPDDLPAGTDPWAGWVVTSDGTHSIGSITPALASSIVHLKLSSRHLPYTADELRSTIPFSFWLDGRTLLASSEVSWMANRYSIIGSPAHPATLKWWGRFQRWMRANTTALRPHRQVTFHAFPSALERLRAGIPYYASGWDLATALAARDPS